MSKLVRMLREAHAAVGESRRTGMPLDEVTDARQERRRVHVAASREVVEAYNDAARRLREHGSPDDRLRAALAMDDLHRLRTGAPVDRRGFLKGAGVTAASLAAAGVLRAAPARAAAAPRIVIVGAGLSGLRTAHKLWIDRGIRSTVYEANADAGGRCETNRTFFLNNQIAEMHGEFVNTEHLAVKNLAARFGLGLDDLYAIPQGTDDSFWINNSRYTVADITADWKAFGYDTFHNAAQQVPAPQTWDNHSALAATWDNQDVATWLANNLPGGTTTKLYKLALESVRGNFGTPDETSALNMVWMWAYNTSKKTAHSYQSNSYLYEDGGDERWHITGGSDLLVSNMIRELPSGTVQYSSAVTAIKKNSDGTYAVSVKSGNRTTTVTADHVVVAAPFSSLRVNTDLSKAGISALKMTAINTLGMSTHGKVIMQFNGHPWYANGFDGNMLTDFPTNWMWELNYQVNNNNAPTGLLLQYPSGPTTQSYISTYKLNQHEGVAAPGLVNQILANVNTYYGPGVKEAYNGKAWYHFGSNDPWVRGGYPFWKVGQVTGFSGIETTREGNIHFGGDTTWDFQGFMEGAVLAGERCAGEI
ncbi:MAG TPA: FAD-dependent oxidoreductase [Gaiellales bacterium]|nr:FAD-dependent oxidoreductase [Gaiellales bacterium]